MLFKDFGKVAYYRNSSKVRNARFIAFFKNWEYFSTPPYSKKITAI